MAGGRLGPDPPRLAARTRGQAGQAFDFSVTLAQSAERWGYRRVWYAEHHNTPTIASSATSVLIAHVAAHTSTIPLGAGGVMLPSHSPLVAAEPWHWPVGPHETDFLTCGSKVSGYFVRFP